MYPAAHILYKCIVYGLRNASEKSIQGDARDARRRPEIMASQCTYTLAYHEAQRPETCRVLSGTRQRQPVLGYARWTHFAIYGVDALADGFVGVRRGLQALPAIMQAVLERDAGEGYRRRAGHGARACSPRSSAPPCQRCRWDHRASSAWRFQRIRPGQWPRPRSPRRAA